MKFKLTELDLNDFVGKKIKQINTEANLVEMVFNDGSSFCIEDFGSQPYHSQVYLREKEPVKKFEVGDEVIYHCYHCPNQIKHKSVIFGIKDNQYAIKYTHKSVDHYAIVKERRLSPLKNKNKLEVGDKFTAYGAKHKFEVLGVANDKYYNQKSYFARQLDGKYKGYTTTVLVQAIKSVIYD